MPDGSSKNAACQRHRKVTTVISLRPFLPESAASWRAALVKKTSERNSENGSYVDRHGAIAWARSRTDRTTRNALAPEGDPAHEETRLRQRGEKAPDCVSESTMSSVPWMSRNQRRCRIVRGVAMATRLKDAASHRETPRNLDDLVVRQVDQSCHCAHVKVDAVETDDALTLVGTRVGRRGTLC